MSCHHVIFNFSGRRIRRFVPASRFSNFIAADGFSVADVSLSTSSPMLTSSPPCGHVRCSLWRHHWHSIQGFEVLSSPTVPNAFLFYGLTGGPGLLSLVLGPLKGLTADGNPSTKLLQVPMSARQTHHFSHAAVCDLEPCDSPFSQIATRPHEFGSMKDPFSSKTIMLLLSIAPNTARACGLWLFEMSFDLRCRTHCVVSVRTFAVDSPRLSIFSPPLWFQINIWPFVWIHN